MTWFDEIRKQAEADAAKDIKAREEIAALQDILKSIQSECAMKYALESLPELIGDHQFRDLCLAMGIETAVQLPSGPEFAEVVSNRVLRVHRERDRHRRDLEKNGLAL